MKRRLLGLLMAVLLGLSTMPGMAAGFIDTDATRYEKAANLLSAMGIISGYTDGTYDINENMTRAEWASILFKMADISDMPSDNVYFYDVKEGYWAREEINTMYLQGYLDCNGQYFYPDRPANLNDISRGVVYLLGYSYYPKEYIAVASELGVFKGITIGSEIKRGDVLLILFNALQTEKSLHRGFMTEEGQYILGDVSEGGTLLEENFDIYKSSGQFTAIENLDLMGGEDTKGKKVRIDNVNYRLAQGQKVDRKLLAYCVEFYYRQTKDMEEGELVYYLPKGENEIVTASAKEIDTTGSTATKLVYEENGRSRTQSILPSAKFIINGHIIADQDITDSLFQIDSGSVTIVTPANNRNMVVWIDRYEYFMVKAPGTKELYLTNGNVINMDGDLENQEVAVYTATGVETTMNDILANSGIALSEVVGEDGILYRDVYVLKNVGGTVKELGTDTITIGENQYERTDTLMGIRIGFEYTFYVGMEGEICLADISLANTLLFGYLINAEADTKGLDQLFEVEIMNAAGEKEIFEIGENLEVNGTLKKKTDILKGGASEFYNSAENKAVRQVVGYMLNSDEALSKLYTVRNTDDSVLKLDAARKARQCKASSLFSFGGELTVKDSGVIFAVPADVDAATRDDFEALPSSFFSNDTSYTIEGYNLNELLEADVLVVEIANVDTANYNPGNTYTCVFDKKTSVVLEDGSTGYSVTYWQQGSKYTKTVAQRDGKKSYTSTLQQIQQLRKGDCFKIELTSDAAQIKNLGIEFQANKRTAGTGAFNYGRRMYYGQVKAVGNSSIVIQQYAESASSDYLSATVTLFKNAARVNTYLYTGEDNPIEYVPNCLADVRVGDWVLMQARNMAPRTLVIYRDENALPNGNQIN